MGVIPNSEYRFLGPTGLRVSSISFGGWVTIGGGMQVDDSEATKILDKAYKSGINFFDTAETYGQGGCETSMGRIIKHLGWRRDTYALSTKLFWAPNREHVNALGLSRKHILEGAKASLERLQHEYVDIIFAHRPDTYTPMEEVVRGFTQLINDGKAFYWGTSMWTAYEIEHAHHIATKYGLIAPVMEQPEYNLLCRENFEKELKPIFDEYNYGSTVFSPLATGLLTGKYTDGSTIPEDSRYSKSQQENSDMVKSIFKRRFEGPDADRQFAAIQKLQTVADRLKVSMPALSLAWLLKQKNVSTLITGASKPEQIELNLKAYEALPLIDQEVLKEIDEIFANKPAARPDFSRLGNF